MFYNRLDGQNFKITGTLRVHGAYLRPIRWRMTAAEVTRAGPEGYLAAVREWAQEILGDLRSSGNWLEGA